MGGTETHPGWSVAADVSAYYQKDIEVADRDAQAATQKAAYDEKIHRDRVRRLISTQRALFGKSGVDTAGSPLLVLEETAGKGELDALAIRYGGEIESERAKSRASLSKTTGRAALTSSFIGAGSTLLTGAAKHKKAKQNA